LDIFRKSAQKIQVPLKYDKNNDYFKVKLYFKVFKETCFLGVWSM